MWTVSLYCSLRNRHCTAIALSSNAITLACSDHLGILLRSCTMSIVYTVRADDVNTICVSCHDGIPFDMSHCKVRTTNVQIVGFT